MRPGMLLIAIMACCRRRVSPTLSWGYLLYVAPICWAIGRCFASSIRVPAPSDVGGAFVIGVISEPAGFVWVVGVLRIVAKDTKLAFFWFISGVSNAVRECIDVSCRFFARVRYLGSCGGL